MHDFTQLHESLATCRLYFTLTSAIESSGVSAVSPACCALSPRSLGRSVRGSFFAAERLCCVTQRFLCHQAGSYAAQRPIAANVNTQVWNIQV
jgi:hypothetical protein